MHVTVYEDKEPYIRELTKEQYQLATSAESQQFMKNLGGKEESKPYGIRSTSPDGVTVAYIGNPDKFPVKIKKLIKQGE